MNIHHLQYFCDVVKTGSFSSSAQMNFVSQTTVSQAVDTLETELNTSLFQHQSRPVAVTSTGRFFYQQAIRILAQYQLAEQKTLTFIQNQQATMRILYVQPSEVAPFVDKFVKFNQQFKDVQLVWCQASVATIYQDLLTGVGDLAICGDLPIKKNDQLLKHQLLATKQMVFGSRIKASQQSLFQQIKESGLHLLKADQLIWQQYRLQAGVPALIEKTSNSVDNLLLQTFTQAGIGLFDRHLFDTWQLAHRYLTPSVPIIQLPIQGWWLSNTHAPRVQQLLNLLRQ